jgi:NTP pyrophosphatase (non-canonical NTP hydrolase)
MKLNEYQDKARTTAVYPDHVGLLYTVLGLVGEAGEIANKVKKVYRDHDGELTHAKRADLIDELGDVLWYVAALAGELGTELEPVAKGNLAKLQERAAKQTIQGEGDKR